MKSELAELKDCEVCWCIDLIS